MPQIELWGFNKRLNSLSIPKVRGDVVEVKLKSETSQYSPSFYLSNVKPNWNYLKYNGYYFYIADVITIRNDYYLITTTLDPLASWRDDIKATFAYVRYSTSKYNAMIPDDRLSVGSFVTQKFSSEKFLSPVSIIDPEKSGTYAISYVTTDATLGPSGCVLMHAKQAKQLAEVINDGGFLEAMQSVKIGEFVTKSIENIYDAIIDCKYIPVDVIPNSQTPHTIRLGSYDTRVGGYSYKGDYIHQAELNIPKPFNDFRDLPPYTDYYIVLPGCGVIPYNGEILAKQLTLPIEMHLDPLSGDIIYYIGNTTRITGNIATPVQLSKVYHPGFNAGFLGMGASTAAAFAGHPGVAVAGIFGSALSLGQVQTGSIGGGNSSSSLYAAPYGLNPGTVYIVAVSRGTNIEPGNLNIHYGQPLNERTALSELVGYVQTVGASVECSAPLEIKEQINSYLNGGVYFE